MLRRLLILGGLLLAVSVLSHAQAGTTIVTALVQDSTGTVYPNCQWSVVFVGENTTPGSGPYKPDALVQGQQGHCDSSGNLGPVNLADNINTVTPTPSQWSFSICSAAGYVGGPYCRTNILVTITGVSLDLTNTFRTLMPLLPNLQTVNLSSPPPIGNTIPNSGTFTNIIANGSISAADPPAFPALLMLSDAACAFTVPTAQDGQCFWQGPFGDRSLFCDGAHCSEQVMTPPQVVAAASGALVTADGGGNYQAKLPCTLNTIAYVGGVCAPTWGGGDIGAQINSAYGSVAANNGAIIYVIPQANGCYNFSTPIAITTAAKNVQLIGLGAPIVNPGNLPYGPCLNWTPTSGTAITWDLGVGGIPGSGIQNIILTNGTSYTNGGPGGATTATGLACGTTNSGMAAGYFPNLTIRGFNIGLLCANSLSFATLFENINLTYNNTPFSYTAQNEGVLFQSGYISVNGNGGNIVSGTMDFQKMHFDSNSAPMTVSGSTSAIVKFTDNHFENLNVGANSCGANSAEYINSSGPSIAISGGEALDDCNTGTNTVYWFNGAIFSVKNLSLSTNGRTPSSAVFVNTDLSDIQVTFAAAGQALAGLVVPNSNPRGNVYISGHATNASIETNRFLLGTGNTAPSCTVTGAGTTATCAISNNTSDSGGTLTISATGTGQAANGTVVLTFGQTMGKNNTISTTALLSNGGTGTWNARATVIRSNTCSSAACTFLWDNNAVALTAASTYAIDFFIVGH